MVVPMEQWAGQQFQDKSADLWVVMLSDHNEKYSDRMERSYKAFTVTFELRFPFPLSWKWRCSWGSADRRCSNYILVIYNFIANSGASYIRGLTVLNVRYWVLVRIGAKCRVRHVQPVFNDWIRDWFLKICLDPAATDDRDLGQHWLR